MATEITPVASQPLAFVEPAKDTPAKGISGHVTMSRALTESAHGLTINEARLIMLALRTVNPRASHRRNAKDGGNVRVRVTAAEFAEVADLKPDEFGYTNRAAYEGLKNACNNIYERSATWREGNKKIKMRWVWKATYHDYEAWAELEFAPDMTPHLFELGERFVRYRIEMARGLRSIYSTNLLRLLMTQKDTGYKTITLEDYRSIMEVPETYRYADIKRYAIVAPVKELNEKADLIIEWKETKRGRAVYSLQFTFKQTEPDPQQTLDL
jgi:hypothetical protein